MRQQKFAHLPAEETANVSTIQAVLTWRGFTFTRGYKANSTREALFLPVPGYFRVVYMSGYTAFHFK